jgi:glycosyltransferase involved in cell wall biosynthesis
VRVSVIVPAWNAGSCIEQALGSALSQSRPADEVLVCDDGSIDGTAERVERRFGAAVTVLRLPHRNASAARRAGIRRSRGDWIAFLDADDRWRPDKLAHQAAFLERHPQVRWLTADGRYVKDGAVLRQSWLSDYFGPLRDVVGDLLAPLLERCFPLTSATLVGREAYDAVGGLDPTLAQAHDYDLWLRLAARYPGAVMAESVVDYHAGTGTLSRDLEARYRDDLTVMRRVAREGLGRGREVRRVAAERAAALEFELALLAVRSGRAREARRRLWRVARRGPWRRRLVALGGALLPVRAVGPLTRSGMLKRVVQRGRRAAGPLALPESGGGRA